MYDFLVCGLFGCVFFFWDSIKLMKFFYYVFGYIVQKLGEVYVGYVVEYGEFLYQIVGIVFIVQFVEGWYDMVMQDVGIYGVDVVDFFLKVQLFFFLYVFDNGVMCQ